MLDQKTQDHYCVMLNVAYYGHSPNIILIFAADTENFSIHCITQLLFTNKNGSTKKNI